MRAPPAGVEFEFNYDVSYPIAVAIMSEDAALEKMRFELVPKIITEENFWRNYFYRVSLICQASGDADAAYGTGNNEGTFGASGAGVRARSSRVCACACACVVLTPHHCHRRSFDVFSSVEAALLFCSFFHNFYIFWTKFFVFSFLRLILLDTRAPRSTSVVQCAATAEPADSASADGTAVVTRSPSNVAMAPSNRRTLSETEFVSDTLQTTDTDLAEVKAGMKLLGIDTLARATADSDSKAGKSRAVRWVGGWVVRVRSAG